MMTPQLVIKKVIDLLETKGWIQGAYCEQDLSGKILGYCITGAIDEACTIDDRPTCFYKVLDAISKTLKETLPHVPRNIVDWNDTPGRTKGEILEILRKTRERLLV